MERNIRQVVETRKTQLADAKARLNAAETALKEKQPLLSERQKQVEDLQKKVDLAKQRNRLSKELLVVLEKLDDATKRASVLEERANRSDGKVRTLSNEADVFESKYQQSKKQYNELIREMEMLGIN